MARDHPATPELLDALERARAVGFLGPGEVGAHLDQARRMAEAVGEPPIRCLDLGSGGGVPALPLACWWPSSTWVLVEAQQRRADLLASLVGALGLTERVVLDARRAEDVGRDPSRRGHADLVSARSFGRPGVVAECAAPLLTLGGRLVVSEPPSGSDARWDPVGLAELGLVDHGERCGCRTLVQAEPCPDRYPRRTGKPERDPLF